MKKHAPMCLMFRYHMYGSDVGRLRVLREDVNGQSELFSESGKCLTHESCNYTGERIQT